MGQLANDAKDLVMLLTRVGAPQGLEDRFLKLSEYAGNMASFIRVNEEFPPEQQPAPVQQISSAPSNVRALPGATPWWRKT